MKSIAIKVELQAEKSYFKLPYQPFTYNEN